MSYISVLKQKIRVIQTIRKTTSAMQLATQAIQSRLRKKQEIFNTYVKTIEQVSEHYKALQQREESKTDHAQPTITPKKIILLIGSHKGLCGAFNERLFAFFKRTASYHNVPPIISIGSQTSRFLASQKIDPWHSFNQFTSTTLTTIAQELITILMNAEPIELLVISNKPRTFFLQQPCLQEVIITKNTSTDPINDFISRLKLQATILKFLYDSLVAEQAARFLSMDSATRNAEEMLAQAKINYNKLRQALVTRELLELTTSELKN